MELKRYRYDIDGPYKTWKYKDSNTRESSGSSLTSKRYSGRTEEVGFLEIRDMSPLMTFSTGR